MAAPGPQGGVGAVIKPDKLERKVEGLIHLLVQGEGGVDEDVFAQCLHGVTETSRGIFHRGRIQASEALGLAQQVSNASAWMRALRADVEIMLEQLKREEQEALRDPGLPKGGSKNPKKRQRPVDKVPSPVPSPVAPVLMSDVPAPVTPINVATLKHLGRTPSEGDFVAGYIRSQEVWILAQVVRHNLHSKVTEVVDADEAQATPSAALAARAGSHHKHTLRPDELMKLPRTNETFGSAYPIGAIVFAMFPNSTCFYPCTVAAKASKKAGKELCYLYFQDDEEDHEDGSKIVPIRSVPSNFVTVLPPREQERLGGHFRL